MASLKEIMNIDEDSSASDPVKRDKETGPNPSQDLDYSASGPSRATHFDQGFALLSSAASPRGPVPSPSSHTAHTLAAERQTSSSSPTASANASRRRSNTSIESMDSSHYYPQSQHGYASSSSSAMRGYMPGPVPGDAPVKLTPITGRVSRAKKGVPVHVCELCRPPKKFTRAEHLRRHQLSHEPPTLACEEPGCDKTFHRRDLLERHRSRHEQEHQQPRPGGGVAGGPYSGAHDDPIYHATGPTDPSDVDDPRVDQYHPAWATHQGGPQMQAPFPGGYPSLSNSDMYIPRTNMTTLDDHHVLHTAWGSDDSSTTSKSTSTFSTPPAPGHQSLIGTGGYHPGYTTSPMDLNMAPTTYDDDGPLYTDYMSNTTVRCLSPSMAMAVAQTSETLVTLSTALPPDPIENRGGCGGALRTGMVVSGTVPAPLSRTVRELIPAYLEVYWNRVHPVYPIIHKSVFDRTSEAALNQLDLLRCSMAALATQFLGDKYHRINGHALHSHTLEMSKIYTADTSEEWTLPMMQTVLLSEYYARFRGRLHGSQKPSPQFNQLYQMLVTQESRCQAIHNGYDASTTWGSWIINESRRRLLAACFLLDVCSRMYFEQPDSHPALLDYLNPSSLPIPLSSSTKDLWEAENYQTWGLLRRVATPVRTISTTDLDLLVSTDIASAPAFDAALLLAAFSLQLPQRRLLTKAPMLESISQVESECLRMTNVFTDSGPAHTYLALYYTPLHNLLSVSGDSWVFNTKVTKAGSFGEHKNVFQEWCTSPNAVVAVSLAARALSAFLETKSAGSNPDALVSRSPWKDISDYWGVYISALICWAYGHGAQASSTSGDASKLTAVWWINTATDLTLEQLQKWPERYDTRAVVCLVRDVLARDCLGGRNLLFADAVGVLKRLAGGNRWF